MSTMEDKEFFLQMGRLDGTMSALAKNISDMRDEFSGLRKEIQELKDGELAQIRAFISVQKLINGGFGAIGLIVVGQIVAWIFSKF